MQRVAHFQGDATTNRDPQHMSTVDADDHPDLVAPTVVDNILPATSVTISCSGVDDTIEADSTHTVVEMEEAHCQEIADDDQSRLLN